MVAIVGTLAALKIISGLLTIATNASISVIKLNILLQTSRAEGRDVTKEELAELRETSDEKEKHIWDRLDELIDEGVD